MICKAIGVDMKSRKTVLVSTLKQGDTFVFSDFGEKYPYAYIVTEVSHSCVEVVSFKGKVFSFGRSVPVIPVKITCEVEVLEVSNDACSSN